jgi:hypothetical protein
MSIKKAIKAIEKERALHRSGYIRESLYLIIAIDKCIDKE